jgi:hypothetical protein
MHAPIDRIASRTLHTALALSALGMASSSFAGRPLAVEDAGVNPERTCQLESWVDQTNNEIGLVLAPACGLGNGVEVGVELNTPRHRARKDAERGIGIKWVPEEGKLGDVTLGAKLSMSQVKVAGGSGWDSGPTSLLGIATYPINAEWTAHVNLGIDFVKNPSDTVPTAGGAIVWTPHKNWLVFAELTGAKDESATRAAGARFWLMPDELGLDFTAAKTNGKKEPTAYTLGVSWYGIQF